MRANAGPAVSLSAAAGNVLCHPRGLLEPRGFGKTSKDPEVRNVAAAALEHHRTDPVDAIASLEKTSSLTKNLILHFCPSIGLKTQVFHKFWKLFLASLPYLCFILVPGWE